MILYVGIRVTVLKQNTAVSDVKSQGQPACQEDQKRCKKEEGVNAMHECDVDKMYAM